MKVSYCGPLGDGVTIGELVFPPKVPVEVDAALGKELAARPDFRRAGETGERQTASDAKPRSPRRSAAAGRRSSKPAKES